MRDLPPKDQGVTKNLSIFKNNECSVLKKKGGQTRLHPCTTTMTVWRKWHISQTMLMTLIFPARWSVSQDSLDLCVKPWNLAHLVAPPAKEKVSHGVFWLESNGFVHMLLERKYKQGNIREQNYQGKRGKSQSCRVGPPLQRAMLEQVICTRPAPGKEEKPFSPWS